MNEDKFNVLNEIYEPIYNKAKSIYKELKLDGYVCNLGWYNNHSVKFKDAFHTEIFPIPVITIDMICDIGIDIDSIFIEFKLNRKDALSVDIEYLNNKYKLDIYGNENYLEEFLDESFH